MYKNFNFISSETIVAEVKQRLFTYFDSGALKEVMIPTYIHNAMRRLRVMTMEYKEDFISIENYKGRLPKDLMYLKDAFLCNKLYQIAHDVHTNTYEYYKKIYCNDDCGNEYETFSQTTQTLPNWIETKLDPQLLRVYYTSKADCSEDCKGLYANTDNVITIHKKTISTTFETGQIYLQYYISPEDEHGPMIPEVIEVEDYIKNTLYLRLYEDLFNNISDESINVIQNKMSYYKQEHRLSYESALNRLKEETKQQTRDNIAKQRRRFIKFQIH
jgi:predicted nucleic acid-binding protein